MEKSGANGMGGLSAYGPQDYHTDRAEATKIPATAR
jgi:hypothetical protein